VTINAPLHSTAIGHQRQMAMLQIEYTLVDMARHHLTRLQYSVEQRLDLSEALESFHQLTSLVVLAHISDSGLSPEATYALRSMELQALNYERWIENNQPK